MKKVKKVRKSVSRSSSLKLSSHDALNSPVIQAGIVFIMIMAFALVAYAAKSYIPQ